MFSVLRVFSGSDMAGEAATKHAKYTKDLEWRWSGLMFGVLSVFSGSDTK